MRLLVFAIVLIASSVLCDVTVRFEEDFTPAIEEIYIEGNEAVTAALDEINKMEAEQQEGDERGRRTGFFQRLLNYFTGESRRKWNCKKHIGETIQPKFCGKYACPSYKLAACGKGYEKRCYGPSTWAMVKMPKGKTGRKVSPFMELFKYISGHNKAKEKIKMTVPVLQAMEYNITDHTIKSAMAFYLNLKKAPAPMDPSVKVRTLPGKCAFVRSFSGRVKSGSKQMWKQVIMLSKALNKQKEKYVKGVSALATYNEPWKLFGRHNEVWRWEKTSDVDDGDDDDDDDDDTREMEEDDYDDDDTRDMEEEEDEDDDDDTTEMEEDTN